MTENQELQAFDETLKEFLKEPDHFLTSLALVNHLQRTPVLAAPVSFAFGGVLRTPKMRFIGSNMGTDY